MKDANFLDDEVSAPNNLDFSDPLSLLSLLKVATKVWESCLKWYWGITMNTGSVPSKNSRLSPLPPEPYDCGATIDIPLDNAKAYCKRNSCHLDFVSFVLDPKQLHSWAPQFFFFCPCLQRY
ncbi:Secretory carrier-associated membrane protein 1 [Glycine soja]